MKIFFLFFKSNIASHTCNDNGQHKTTTAACRDACNDETSKALLVPSTADSGDDTDTTDGDQ